MFSITSNPFYSSNSPSDSFHFLFIITSEYSRFKWPAVMGLCLPIYIAKIPKTQNNGSTAAVLHQRLCLVQFSQRGVLTAIASVAKWLVHIPRCLELNILSSILSTYYPHIINWTYYLPLLTYSVTRITECSLACWKFDNNGSMYIYYFLDNEKSVRKIIGVCFLNV